MAGAFPLLVLLTLSGVGAPLVTRAADTVAAGRPLYGRHTLVSPSGKFALGFFQPDRGEARRWYIGIWYNKISSQTPIWVANRDRPVSQRFSSQLAIASDNNLSLFDRSGMVVWSTSANTNTVVASASSTVAVLLDTGNLVLAPASNVSLVLWQSFDHFGDTWLPGGKLIRNNLTDTIDGMTSWRARGDPARGMYTFQLDPAEAPRYVLLWNDTQEYWTSGNWTSQFFADAPDLTAGNDGFEYNFKYVDNDEESYFMFNIAINTTVYRFVLDVSGKIKGWAWVEDTHMWILVYAKPKALCTVPRVCGPFGVCRDDGVPKACDCARGFSPWSPSSWSLGDYTDGCVRNTHLRCNGDRFFHMDAARLPDDTRFVAGPASSGDCERACLADCSCSAYGYNSSCFLWQHDILNLQEGFSAGSLFIRLPASELPRPHRHRRRTIEITVGAFVVVCLVITASFLLVRTTRKRRRERFRGLIGADGRVISFKFRDLQYMTKSFSEKIGGGAFGSVFKGQFSDHTTFAVKKLEGLRQGEKQFRAEVSTLGTIQHVNLIHMLGFCSDDGARKLLVYEYMSNGLLDRHLFRTTLYILSWEARYNIALGVAKGLAYLHDKCRDCIIHCDIKPENILLDGNFTPMVADFGLAKLVGHDFSHVLTTIRGTIGYLAPEWISGEAITAKADVFSYGMMLFEMVSGRRNVEQGEMQHESSTTASGTTTFFPVLIARKLIDGDLITLLDPRLEGNVDGSELKRVCMIACWCIQHNMDARPTMAELVQVLQGLRNVHMPPVLTYLEAIAG